MDEKTVFDNHAHKDLLLLFSEYSEGQLNEKQTRELDDLLQKSFQARFLYVKYRAIEAKMERWFGRSEPDPMDMPSDAICDMDNLDLRQAWARGTAEKCVPLSGKMSLTESLEQVPWGGSFELGSGLDTTVVDVTAESWGTTVLAGLRSPVAMWGSVTFSLAMIVAVFFTFVYSNHSQRIGKVAQTVNAVWEGDVRESDFETLGVGSRLNLKSGLVQVRYSNGVRVNLEGPVAYEVSGPNEGELLFGKISALVNHDSTGFAIQTPIGQIIDLGTEFGIDVAQNQNTKVQVFDGHVKLVLSDDEKNPQQGRTFELTKDHSVLVDSHRWSVKKASYTPEQYTRNYEDLGSYYLDDFSIDTAGEYAGNYSLWGTREGSHSVADGRLVTHVKATTYTIHSIRRLLGVGEFFAVDVPPIKSGLSVFASVSTVIGRPQGGIKGAGGFCLQRDEEGGLVVQQCDFERIPRSGKASLFIGPSRIVDPAPGKPLRLIIERSKKTEFVFYYELNGVRTKMWGPIDYPNLAATERLHVGVGVCGRTVQKQTAVFDNFLVRSAQDQDEL